MNSTQDIGRCAPSTEFLVFRKWCLTEMEADGDRFWRYKGRHSMTCERSSLY